MVAKNALLLNSGGSIIIISGQHQAIAVSIRKAAFFSVNVKKMLGAICPANSHIPAPNRRHRKK